MIIHHIKRTVVGPECNVLIMVKHVHLISYKLLGYHSNDIMDRTNHEDVNNGLRKIIDEGCLTTPTTLERGIETNINTIGGPNL